MNNSDLLPEIKVSDDCVYTAVFLTMSCPYHCGYCINEHQSARKHFRHISASDWVRGLSRLTNLDRTQGPVPITLSGGEPSVHPGFYDVINNLPDRIRIDILTNLSFDVQEMIHRVDPDRLRRDAPYASIRVSYHPTEVQLDELLEKTQRLMDANFSVGIWGVLHPDQEDLIIKAQTIAKSRGIDFRTKEFLGVAHGRLFGRYKFPDACLQENCRQVLCRTSELIIAPNGGIYRCHHDLYEDFPPIGNILDPDFQMTADYRPCNYYGHCNPCDVKLKTNWLQQFGHTSVSIKFQDQHNSEQTPAQLTNSIT